MSADARQVAYIMNGFPRLSETFIANEIHLLEKMGLRLRLFSVKREDEPIRHPVVSMIKAPLRYLPDATSLSGTSAWRWLRQNVPTFADGNRAIARRHPLRYVATLASAIAMCWKYRAAPLKPRKVFLKEFLQAAQIAGEIEVAGNVGHLHGHFCHGVATITWFVSQLTGIPFSFTAHAKDIYQADLNPGDLLDRKLTAARFVVTCTDANAQVLKARQHGATIVHTIYHGLDTDFFSPRTAGAQPPPMILSVGRLVEKKGFNYLIDACAKLKHEGLDFTCIIVGERGSAYEAIARQIDDLGLREVVQLASAVPQDQLREVYRAARVFALPCQVMEDGDRDGIPNVLAEAMAMGVPVVSTRISGIPELIEDGRHGVLVESRDADALADALRRVLTDDALHARLARAGRFQICEVFDSRRTTIALRDLFVDALGGDNAPRTLPSAPPLRAAAR